MRILYICPYTLTIKGAQSAFAGLLRLEYTITAADWLLTIRDNTRQLETVSVASSFRATRELQSIIPWLFFLSPSSSRLPFSSFHQSGCFSLLFRDFLIFDFALF